jgi:SAM-dependent methyltransferase
MPLRTGAGRLTFFADRQLDDDLPITNEVFWECLIEHIERDGLIVPRTILDVGCHTGGFLAALANRFSPNQLIGIEPLVEARREASQRLLALTPRVQILDPEEWGQVTSGSVDLVTSHEVLYLEPDLQTSMARFHRVLAPSRVAYLVLGMHTENPLWNEWKELLVTNGHRVYGHAPIEIMRAASSEGFLPSVQPLRRSGWVTYDPLQADFPYPDARTMLDHHYRHKLVFRLLKADELAT